MKKIQYILILLALASFAIVMACQPTSKIEVIDGCQYIVTSSYNGNGVFIEDKCHKGNCNNPIHAYPGKTSNIDTVQYSKIQLEWQAKIDSLNKEFTHKLK